MSPSNRHIRRAFVNALRLLCTVSPLSFSSTALAHALPPNGNSGAGGDGVSLVDHTPIKTLPPSGFGDIDQPVHTLFDVVFEGRNVGSFDAILINGKLTFTDPAKVVAALGDEVNAAAATALLSKPLEAHEQYSCKPGQSTDSGCGLLPKGLSGIIVNSDTFEVTLLLGSDYLISHPEAPRMLGAPESGLSLIQGIRFSLSSDGQSQANYGGTFDTTISDGRTALVAQTTLSQQTGFQAQELYAQRIWSDRRVAAGMLQDFQSLTLDNYRMAGVEFGSFYGTYLDQSNDNATPVQIVLPRRAQVEVYRDNVLIYTGQYEAGLQLIDTRSFPTGSYSVHIVARDGPNTLVDERRSFSKLANLPPPGKTGFLFRVGERLQDSFTDSGLSTIQPFFPGTTGELVASASVERRLGHDFAAGLSVTSFNARVFSEASLQFFLGKFSGLIGGGVGSDGAVSAIVSTSVQFNSISFFLSGRSTHADETQATVPPNIKRYEPFAETEDTIFASAQKKLFGGSFSLSGTYTHTPGTPNQYAVEAQYTRQIKVPFAGSALLSFNLTASDIDRQAGFTLSFFKQVTPKTDIVATAGATYVTDSDGSERTGLVPTGELTLSHNDRYGPFDVTGQVGGSTDIDGDRVFAQVDAKSSYGSFDGIAQRLYPIGSAATNSLLLNGQTGFTIGGGAVKIGISNPGDAVLLVDMRSGKSDPPHVSGVVGPVLPEPTTDSGTSSPVIAQGGYRITVNTHEYDFIKPGQLVAIGLPALKQYNVNLKPEGAPQFDLDQTERDNIALYPGNVVRLHFQSRQVVTLYGRIMNTAGQPLAFSRVSAENDYITTDELGYFVITAPVETSLSVKTRDGAACAPVPIQPLIHGEKTTQLYRVGAIVCHITSPASPAPAPLTAPTVPQAAMPHEAHSVSWNASSGQSFQGLHSISKRHYLSIAANHRKLFYSYKSLNSYCKNHTMSCKFREMRVMVSKNYRQKFAHIISNSRRMG